MALVVVLVILFVTFAYTGLQIEALSTRADAIQAQLFLKEKEIAELKSHLTQSKDELDKLIKGRLPTAMKLVPDKVLAVNTDNIKNIVFTEVKQDGVKRYEYKLVVENHSHKIIIPKFRLLIFDKYGLQIGVDQLLSGEELGPGESRSYSSKVDFFIKEDPAYFHVSSTIPSGAQRMQSLLNNQPR